MSINLKNCKPGIKLVTRNGQQGLYERYDIGCSSHLIIVPSTGSYYVTDYGNRTSCLGEDPLDIVAFAITRLDDADIFSTLPEGITEVVYKGERYKKQVKTTWIKF